MLALRRGFRLIVVPRHAALARLVGAIPKLAEVVFVAEFAGPTLDFHTLWRFNVSSQFIIHLLVCNLVFCRSIAVSPERARPGRHAYLALHDGARPGVALALYPEDAVATLMIVWLIAIDEERHVNLHRLVGQRLGICFLLFADVISDVFWSQMLLTDWTRAGPTQMR